MFQSWDFYYNETIDGAICYQLDLLSYSTVRIDVLFR